MSDRDSAVRLLTRALPVTLLLGFGAVASAHAQLVRGVARDSAAQAPLPGVVISAIDSAGVPVGRTIADASGRFAVTSARAVHLHAVRIGYRPRDFALPPNSPDTVIDLVMSRIPPMLEAVRVSDRELCPGSDDRGPAFQLWEQARAGLLATVVARDARPAMASTLVYDRVMLPKDDLVRQQSVRVRTGRTTQPFAASGSAQAFARRGYMIDDPTGRLYSAPDADVLLDESFAATHCFHLEQGKEEHRDEMGLAFVPAPGDGRDTLVDVAGVIWIAPARPELRSFEFRYTGLEPAAMRASAGGHLEFHTAQNGVSFIERWSMRLPVLAQGPPIMQTTPGVTMPRTPRRQDRTDVSLAQMHESGGIVLNAKWDDGTSWADTLTGVSGVIVEQKSSRPATRAIATIVGTSDTVTTNERGEFSLVPLPPGRYSVVLSDTALSAYTQDRRATREVDVRRGSIASLRVEVPALADVVAKICEGQRPREHTATLTGRVAPKGESLPRHASVRARWQSDYDFAGSLATVHESDQQSSVDERGRFLVCNVATERPVRLSVTAGTRTADTIVKVLDTSLVSVDWTPTLHAISTQALAVRGTVLREGASTPIDGAIVSIPTLAVSTTTSSDGSFELRGLAPGSYALTIRHVGDAQLSDSVVVTADAAPRTFRLGHVVALDTVRTQAADRSYISPTLRAFEERRLSGVGNFISDAELRASEGMRLGDVIRARMSSIRVQSVRDEAYVVSGRDARSGPFAILPSGDNRRRCYATVYLDGVLLFENTPTRASEMPPNLNEFQVSHLAGIEYYPGASTTPMSFRSSECGTLMLWTREK